MYRYWFSRDILWIHRQKDKRISREMVRVFRMQLQNFFVPLSTASAQKRFTFLNRFMTRCLKMTPIFLQGQK